MPTNVRHWLADCIVGGITGGILGAIVAVNIIHFSGMSRGYETGIAQVFEENVVVGIAVMTALAGGPLVGVVVARRLRVRS